jgi:hypothetical protein
MKLAALQRLLQQRGHIKMFFVTDTFCGCGIVHGLRQSGEEVSVDVGVSVQVSLVSGTIASRLIVATSPAAKCHGITGCVQPASEAMQRIDPVSGLGNELPIACSWSGGKDSRLALHRARSCGAQPVALLTMFDAGGEPSRSLVVIHRRTSGSAAVPMFLP